MLSWHVKAVHDKENASRDVVLKLLTKEQISANTTRGTTPGLVDPSLGIFSPSIPHPPEKSASALAKVGWFKTSTSSGKRSSNKFSKEFTKTVKKISAPKVKKVKKSMMMDSTRDNETIDTIEGQPMVSHNLHRSISKNNVRWIADLKICRTLLFLVKDQTRHIRNHIRLITSTLQRFLVSAKDKTWHIRDHTSFTTLTSRRPLLSIRDQS